jgi:hypothetical protein
MTREAPVRAEPHPTRSFGIFTGCVCIQLPCGNQQTGQNMVGFWEESKGRSRAEGGGNVLGELGCRWWC